MDSDLSSHVEKERNLYESNQQQLNKSLAGVSARITQYREKLAELKEHSQELKDEMEIVQKRVDINTPLVERKIVSEVEFLKLQQEQNNVQQVLTKTRKQSLTKPKTCWMRPSWLSKTKRKWNSTVLMLS